MSESENGINSAFPLPNNSKYDHETGLKKRELIAAMAMQGMLSGNPERLICGNYNENEIALAATKFADALLAHL